MTQPLLLDAPSSAPDLVLARLRFAAADAAWESWEETGEMPADLALCHEYFDAWQHLGRAERAAIKHN